MDGFAAGTAVLAVLVIAAAAVLGHRRGFEKGARLYRQSEQRLRDLLESVGEGIITIDRFGAIQTFNRAAENMFGYSAGEVVGRNIGILMPDPEAQAHAGYVERYIVQGEARAMRGSRFPTAGSNT